MVCYYSSWAVDRQEPMNFGPYSVDVDKCTHLIYAFAAVDPVTYEIKPGDHDRDIVQGDFDQG